MHKHQIVTKGGLSVVKFGVRLGSKQAEKYLAQYGLVPGDEHDILVLREINESWSTFLPLVALGGIIRRGRKKLVAFVPKGGNPFQIVVRPWRGRWPVETWFIAKKKLDS